MYQKWLFTFCCKGHHGDFQIKEIRDLLKIILRIGKIDLIF
jgi:hypothetical protein